jgi:pimeloyl-ACP methyl ester carboxylesterase
MRQLMDKYQDHRHTNRGAPSKPQATRRVWMTIGDAAMTTTVPNAIKPPSKLLLLAEIRVVYEFALGVASLPTLATAPRGDGHTVLVLPGFLTSDSSTDFLRTYLRGIGLNAVGWEMGRNLGGLYRMRDMLRAKVSDLARQSGRRISVLGWSLGGVYARDLALALPEAIRGIITLGSPFTGDLRANNVGKLYDRVSGEHVDEAQIEDVAALAGDLPVPATSIYSRTDGVVSWQTSLVRENARAENIEVHGASHLGLGFNPAVLWAIADRLAQKEGSFARFGRTGPFALAYRGAGK